MINGLDENEVLKELNSAAEKMIMSGAPISPNDKDARAYGLISSAACVISGLIYENNRLSEKAREQLRQAKEDENRNAENIKRLDAAHKAASIRAGVAQSELENAREQLRQANVSIVNIQTQYKALGEMYTAESAEVRKLKEQLEQVNGAYKTAAERADKAESQVHALKRANRESEQEFSRAAQKVGEMEKEIAELKRKLAAALPKCDISAQIARALKAYRVDHGQPAEQIVMTSPAWEMLKAEQAGVRCRNSGMDVPGCWEYMGVPIAILDTNSKPRFVLFGGAEKHDIEW